MEKHRVRKTNKKALCSAIFVEIKKDTWLEINKIPTHNELHKFLDAQELAGYLPLTYATRAFDIGIIKNCPEVDIIY